jgi:hypothetical protein
LTDYDPTGYQIAEDFSRRSETLGINVDRVKRVGVEPDQVPQQTLANERFRVPVENENDKQWLQNHGIKDDSGNPVFGLELEAIGSRGSQAADFRRVVTNALEPHLEKTRRREKDLNIETANVVHRTKEVFKPNLSHTFLFCIGPRNILFGGLDYISLNRNVIPLLSQDAGDTF